MDANANNESQRNRRRTLQGVVLGNKMDKTISVRVERLFKHPKYKKYIRRHSKYLAHDEDSQANTGDIVEIMECRPLSKNKRFRLNSVIQVAVADGGDL